MAIEIKRRRGTTVDHSTFTGAAGELTIDLDKDTVVVHDGATVAGFPLMREDLSNASNITAFAKTVLDDATAAAMLTTLGVSAFAQASVLTAADVDALKTLLGVSTILPAGMVEYYAGTTAPTGWLLCDGSAVSRATYADLFAAVGVVYGAGDGTTTFNLPDLRGEFIRGNDEGRGVDAGRTVGSTQTGANLAHTHTLQCTEYTGGDDAAMSGSGSAHWLLANRVLRYGTVSIAGGSAVSSGGTEARPRNVSLLPCIKY